MNNQEINPPLNTDDSPKKLENEDVNEWKVEAIGQICNVKGGKRLPAGKEFADGVTPFPYLRVTDMVNGTKEF
jgi:hypothetical protein